MRYNQTVRFIPTYVGHTSTGRCPSQSGRFIPTYVGYTLGGPQPPPALRFIPTYVGYTASTRSPSSVRTVHPHIRGAYLHILPETTAENGSSPHTWGIQSGHKLRYADCGSSPHTWGIPRTYTPARQWYRFIPTYVGHTEPIDYERKKQTGSSPHTWGIHSAAANRGQLIRFIPTYVGHTLDRRKKNGWFQPLLL